MATSYQHQNLVVVPEDDPLEAISRQGAQRMLTAALEREVEEYLERQRYVRHLDESEFRGYRNGSTMRLCTDAAKKFRTARSGVHLVFKLFQRY